jgi:hypothetical protein
MTLPAEGSEKAKRKTGYKKGPTTFYVLGAIDVGQDTPGCTTPILAGPFTKITQAMEADIPKGDFDVVSVRYRGTRDVKTVAETKKRK